MNYYWTKKTNLSFEDAIDKMSTALKEEGFGIISEIDVKDTLKKKITSTSEITKYSERVTRVMLIRQFSLKIKLVHCFLVILSCRSI